MAKRGALSEMNHDNWDQDDESEEAGVFRQATKEVIKQRPMKKAKRRGVSGQTDGQGDDGEAGPAAFKGFSGFVSSNNKPVFSFNKEGAKPLFTGFSNGGAIAPFSLDKGTSKTLDTVKPETSVDKPGLAVNGSGSTNRSKYLQQLCALNESVAKWITEHVSKNGHCILTPIFKDYEKHLAEVEKLNPDKVPTASQPASEKSVANKEKEDPSPGTEKKSSPEKPIEAAAAAPFSFSSSTPASSSLASSTTTTSALFGSSASSTSTTSALFGSSTVFASSGFSFGTASSGFSFGSTTATPATATTKPDEEEEYVPPTEEVTEVKEDDAFYTKKCKLYFQKSGAWVERGVGHIHLKPCGDKTQFIVRADTNLGNILMNIMLSASIPLARQGKNNLTMMCMANPPIDPKEKDPKPTSFLIRVKTGEDADELLEKLKECQK